MNPFNNRFVDEKLGERRAINDASPKLLGFPLMIAPSYIDLLHDLPEFRDLTMEQLLKLLPKRYHQFVPPIGESLPIREAAYEREVRMARAVVIGMLAQPEQIERHKSQMFLERL